MSLSDILISLLLSSLLTSLLFHQYASLSHHGKQQSLLFNHQFEQMLLVKLLTDSIHQAGFLPCGSQSLFAIWDASQSQWLDKPAMIFKSNRLTTHYMASNFQPLLPEYSHQTVVANVAGLKSQQTVLLTNCEFSELNRIKVIHTTGRQFKIMLTYPSHFIVDEDSYIGEWRQDQFNYRKGIIFFGDKKKERLTSDINQFQIAQLKDSLIHISWQYRQLPPFDLIINKSNVPS